MIKKRLAFIDHPFHLKTKSSHFFVDFLSESFNVDVFHLDSDPRDQLLLIKNNNYDFIICWQTEFCSPFFILNNIPVICIPMYDGVENMPDWYWASMNKSRFICFSKTLHFRLKKLGIDTCYVQYYGDGKPETHQVEFDTLRGFFWQRRPEEGLDYKFARHVFRKSSSNPRSMLRHIAEKNYDNGLILSSLHIHNAPDSEDFADWEPDFTCSVSYFADNANQYKKCLKKANVFLCPRKTEGIGLAMIEALSIGMLVIAHDAPTANEYIVNGVNGLLIDYDHPPFLDLDIVSAKMMGEKAREVALKKCQEWTTQKSYLIFFISTTPLLLYEPSMIKYLPLYLDACSLYYVNHPRFMLNLQNMVRSGFMNSDPKTISQLHRISFRVKTIPGLLYIYRLFRALVRKSKMLLRFR